MPRLRPSSIPAYLACIGRTPQVFVLLRCAGCGRGGLATIIDDGAQIGGDLIDFYPFQVEIAKVPPGVPAPAAVGAARANIPLEQLGTLTARSLVSARWQSQRIARGWDCRRRS